MTNSQKSTSSDQTEHCLNMMTGINKRTNINKSQKIKQVSSDAMKYYKNTTDDHHNQVLGWPSGFPSWPPISYPCRFCNKEFRSAQALGGHMNSHRMDRAKLRSCSTLREEMTKKKAKIHQDLDSLKHKIASSSVAMLTTTKKSEKIEALDLEIGMQKQELDLELRLGYT